ncbi:DUF6776 family protein [Alteromonas sp. A081]|uniref:DUF6776 family protein n=1 Tax=Alteromonas sp. A081 TaxID=3410269 RepID=UPI003B980D0F
MTTDQLKTLLGNHKFALLVAFLMLIMLGFGFQLARYIDKGDRLIVKAQKETIAILSNENNKLTTRVNQLDVEMELTQLESESLTKTLVETRRQLEEQQQLLTFYERVVAPEKSDSVFVADDIEVFSLGDNNYQLRMVLLQPTQQKSVINGSLQLSIKGALGGKTVAYTTNGDNFIGDDIAFRFRYFQAVSVDFSLPETFEPESLSMSTTVYRYKTNKGNYERTLLWSDIETDISRSDVSQSPVSTL